MSDYYLASPVSDDIHESLISAHYDTYQQYHPYATTRASYTVPSDITHRVSYDYPDHYDQWSTSDNEYGNNEYHHNGDVAATSEGSATSYDDTPSDDDCGYNHSISVEMHTSDTRPTDDSTPLSSRAASPEVDPMLTTIALQLLGAPTSNGSPNVSIFASPIGMTNPAAPAFQVDADTADEQSETEQDPGRPPCGHCYQRSCEPVGTFPALHCPWLGIHPLARSDRKLQRLLPGTPEFIAHHLKDLSTCSKVSHSAASFDEWLSQWRNNPSYPERRMWSPTIAHLLPKGWKDRQSPRILRRHISAHEVKHSADSASNRLGQTHRTDDW